MHQLPDYRRMLLLTEGALGVFTSKTAAALLRYRPGHVAGVIDAAAAGRDIRELIPWSPPVQILPNVAAAASLGADALVIGVHPEGGTLPDAMRAPIREALAVGIDVVNGLHVFLAEDESFASAARSGRARIHDLRRPPRERIVASGMARTTRCRRVLTVGTDCSVGKMVAALELAAAARRRGLDSRFVATGQTGITIAGRGICVDACVADFAAGAVEQMVIDAASGDVCFVEGQGALSHPGYSGVTLALMHGACPDAMILVHRLGRTHFKAPPHHPLPEMRSLVEAYERTAALLHPARVAGVALNSIGAPEPVAEQARRELEQELGLPVADPVREPCDVLLDAALGH